jgi:hypothetical protein
MKQDVWLGEEDRLSWLGLGAYGVSLVMPTPAFMAAFFFYSFNLRLSWKYVWHL